MSSQWKAWNQVFDRHLAQQCLLPRGPPIARIHTSDMWGEAPYTHCAGLCSGNNKPGSTQCTFIRGVKLWVMHSTLGMWYEVTGEIWNEAASVMHVCNMTANSLKLHLIWRFAWKQLTALVMRHAVCSRKARKNEKQSQFYHGSLNIDLLIWAYSGLNFISNKVPVFMMVLMKTRLRDFLWGCLSFISLTAFWVDQIAKPKT